LVESLELPLVTNYIQQNSAAEHSTSSLSSAEALKNMKFEGIEIAQIQIPSSAISIPSISYSLKASAEERVRSSNYRFTQQIKNILLYR
jgi:hypothetical protein